MAQLIAEIGAPDARQRVLISNLAAMITRFEMLTTTALAGQYADDEQMTRLSNAISRLLACLKFKGSPTSAPDLRSYLRTRDQQKRPSEPVTGISRTV